MITVKELPLKEFIECCKDTLVKFMKEPTVEPTSLGKMEYKEFTVLTAFSKGDKVLYHYRHNTPSSRDVRMLLEIEGIRIVEGFWSVVELNCLLDKMESESIGRKGW